MTEVWTHDDGSTAELVVADTDPGDWFPESPGHRPPVTYELRSAGVAVGVWTVFPVEPWGPWDALVDLLAREGWRPPAEEYRTCEHGLSADLCAGPNHYPNEGETS